jgi:hypothetical protein
MYRAGADGRLNRHFLAAGWNLVRLQLLGQAPDLSAYGESVLDSGGACSRMKLWRGTCRVQDHQDTLFGLSALQISYNCPHRERVTSRGRPSLRAYDGKLDGGDPQVHRGRGLMSPFCRCLPVPSAHVTWVSRGM